MTRSLTWQQHSRRCISGWICPRASVKLGRVLKPGGTFFLCNESDGDHAQDEKWTEKIPGMTIYKDTQLKTMLEQVGFRQVETHKNGKGWLCVTARK